MLCTVKMGISTSLHTSDSGLHVPLYRPTSRPQIIRSTRRTPSNNSACAKHSDGSKHGHAHVFQARCSQYPQASQRRPTHLSPGAQWCIRRRSPARSTRAMLTNSMFVSVLDMTRLPSSPHSSLLNWGGIKTITSNLAQRLWVIISTRRSDCVTTWQRTCTATVTTMSNCFGTRTPKHTSPSYGAKSSSYAAEKR